MKFRPEPEQLAFAASLRELLHDADTASVIRAWADGDPGPGRKLWSRLADLGVPLLGRVDQGATPVDLVLAFIELGRAAVPGPFVESVAVLPALGVHVDPDALATVAVPPHTPYAVDAGVADAVFLVKDGLLARARVVREHTSVDRARQLATVEAAEPVAEVDAAAAVERGALTTAAYLHGAGQALLDRAVAYARQRRQFGVPIGSFQAVKHQLADVAVALELARPLLFGASLTLLPREVSAAKVACTAAAYRAARVALQVHGAIGYTAEYDLALWLTKVRALASAWGTQRVHRDRVWEALR